MIITITGASGFVGQNLQQYLRDRRYKVIPLSLRNENWKNHIEGHAIVHLAGKAHDTANTSKEDGYFQVNRDLTYTVDNTCRSDQRNGQSRRCFASTFEFRATEKINRILCSLQHQDQAGTGY